MKVFISYRRDDSAGYAGRLFDYLIPTFGTNNVFMDIDTIEPGQDFRKVVTNAIGVCNVVLVMIGKQWLNMADAQGRRRLDDPRDWVRVEIAAALANPNVRVIPVLVRDARMPTADELPDDLKELSWRNAIELSDGRFQHDVRKLIGVIERIVVKPQPVPPRGQPKIRLSRYWGAGLVVVGLVLIIGMVGYGIFTRMSFKTPTIKGVSTSITFNLSFSTSDPVNPALPTATSSPVPIATEFEEVPVQLSTPMVVPHASDAVYDYYSQVSSGNYETTWNLLTDFYKTSNNPTGIEDYKKFWDRVDRVIVTNTSTVYDDGKTATIIVDLEYYYLDGRVVSSYGKEINLIYDKARQTWLINSTP